MINRSIFKVDDVFFIEGRGTIVTGTLISGLLKKGMKAIINGKSSALISIEAHNQSLESLSIGTPAGLLLSDINKKDVVKGNTYTFE
jgi:selenocysteine-specific translation elongation factor